MNLSKSYVYLHKDKNGVVFYVGEGTKQCAYSKSNRNVYWKAVASQGYTIEIIKDDMDDETAKILRLALIEGYQPRCNFNKSSEVSMYYRNRDE